MNYMKNFIWAEQDYQLQCITCCKSDLCWGIYIFHKGGHGDYVTIVNPVTLDNVSWLQGRWQGKLLRNMVHIIEK